MRTPKGVGYFLLFWLLCNYLTAYALSVANTLLVRYGAAPFSHNGVLLLSQLLGTLLPALTALYAAKRLCKGARPRLTVQRPTAKLVLWAVLLGLLIQPAGMFVSYVSPAADTASYDILRGMTMDNHLFVNLLLMALLPAVAEELACRGAVLNGHGGAPPAYAAVINGLIFGLMHMNSRQFFYAALLGAAFALVVLCSRNILYGMVMHFTVNASQIMMSVLLQKAVSALPEGAAAPEQAGLSGGMGIPVGFMAFAALFTYLFFRAYKKFKSNFNEQKETDGAAVVSARAALVNWPTLLFAALSVGIIVLNLLSV